MEDSQGIIDTPHAGYGLEEGSGRRASASQSVPAAVLLCCLDRGQTGPVPPAAPVRTRATGGTEARRKKGTGQQQERARMARTEMRLRQVMIRRTHGFMPGIKDEKGIISAIRVTGRAQNVGLRAQVGNPHP